MIILYYYTIADHICNRCHRGDKKIMADNPNKFQDL